MNENDESRQTIIFIAFVVVLSYGLFMHAKYNKAKETIELMRRYPTKEAFEEYADGMGYLSERGPSRWDY